MLKKIGNGLLVAANLWLGYKYLMEGFEKFESLDRLIGRSSPFIDFYLAMGETSYLLPFIGVVEILAALLILSQVFRFVGSLILLPVALNVCLAHIVLIQSPKGIALTSFFLLVILVNLALEYKRFKPILRFSKVW